MMKNGLAIFLLLNILDHMSSTRILQATVTFVESSKFNKKSKGISNVQSYE